MPPAGDTAVKTGGEGGGVTQQPVQVPQLGTGMSSQAGCLEWCEGRRSRRTVRGGGHGLWEACRLL